MLMHPFSFVEYLLTRLALIFVKGRSIIMDLYYENSEQLIFVLTVISFRLIHIQNGIGRRKFNQPSFLLITFRWSLVYKFICNFYVSQL